MIANKVLTSARFDSNRAKTLAKIAKKLNISKNAVLENALDLYAESVLGVTLGDDVRSDVRNDITSDSISDSVDERLGAVEVALNELQASVTSEMIGKIISSVTSEMIAKVMSDVDSRLVKLEANATQVPPIDKIANDVVEQPAIEPAIEAPLETQNTPQLLTNAEMKARLGYGNSDVDNVAFSKISAAGRTEDGYQDANGVRWFVAGKGKASKWNKQ